MTNDQQQPTDFQCSFCVYTLGWVPKVPHSYDPRHKPDEAKQQGIDAFATTGRPLSLEETIEFINRPVSLGFPEAIAGGKRGPKPKRNQYDLAYERRKGLYHKLVRWPQAGAQARRKIGDNSMESVAAIVKELPPTTKRREVVNKIQRIMRQRNMPMHDETTIRSKLRNIRIKAPK